MTDDSTRRSFLAAGVALGGVLAGCTSAPTSSPTRSDAPPATDASTTRSGTPADGGATTARPSVPNSIRAERIAGGFTSPVGVEIPTADGRYYVVDQPGQIHLVEDGSVRDEPFLDVEAQVVDVRGGYSEMGLLGLAFHPDYPDDNRFYVRYSAPRRAGTPSNFSHTFVLSAFRADADAARARPASERPLMEIPQPQGNHNAGAITFGPDGYLYVATGDGGASNDAARGHVSDWYGRNRGGNGQDVTENLLGSILRIDVESTGENRPYGIPDDNPLVGRDGLDEQFAWGFRNPWRMSFTGDRLFAADVGQNRFEEVDIVRKGGNYGWNVKEGTHCFSTASPSTPPEQCPSETDDGDPLVDPIVEYAHGSDQLGGVAVVGGYFYTGDAIPGLTGRYVFADWAARNRLFVATPADGQWTTTTVEVSPDFGTYLLAFGRDPSDELAICTSQNGGVTGSTGELYGLRPA